MIIDYDKDKKMFRVRTVVEGRKMITMILEKDIENAKLKQEEVVVTKGDDDKEVQEKILDRMNKIDRRYFNTQDTIKVAMNVSRDNIAPFTKEIYTGNIDDPGGCNLYVCMEVFKNTDPEGKTFPYILPYNRVIGSTEYSHICSKAVKDSQNEDHPAQYVYKILSDWEEVTKKNLVR